MLVKRAERHLALSRTTPNIVNINLPTQPTSKATPSPYRTKKKRFQDIDRNIKKAQMLDNSETFLSLPDNFISIESNLSQKEDPKNSRTTYQQYKQGQRDLKHMYQSKMGFLKSKFLQLKRAHQVKSTSTKTFQKSPLQTPMKRRMSMVIMNSGSAQQSVNGDYSPSKSDGFQNSVTFSIKTAQGRRRRIDSASYITNLQQKRENNKNVDKNTKPVWPHLDQQQLVLFHVHTPNIKPNSNHLTARTQRRRCINIQKERRRMLEEGEREEVKSSFRPWSARKSQVAD